MFVLHKQESACGLLSAQEIGKFESHDHYRLSCVDIFHHAAAYCLHKNCMSILASTQRYIAV